VISLSLLRFFYRPPISSLAPRFFSSPLSFFLAPAIFVSLNDNDNVNVNDNVNDIGAKAPEPGGSPAPKHTRFIKPTLADVKAYCVVRQNNVDPERFINYYEANGWHVGKNPMKDWQAAVRTWEQNGISSTTRKYNAREPPIAQTDANFDVDAMAALFNGR